MDVSVLQGFLNYGLAVAQLLDNVAHGFSLSEIPEAYQAVMGAKVEIDSAKQALAEYLALAPADQASVNASIAANMPQFKDAEVGVIIQTVLSFLIACVPVIQLVKKP